jgi:hypothetical protein
MVNLAQVLLGTASTSVLKPSSLAFAALSSIKLRKGHGNFWHEKDGIAREEVRDGHSEDLCTRRESFGFLIQTGVRCFLA